MAQIASFLFGVFAVTWGLCLGLRAAAVDGGLSVLLAWLLPTVWAPTVIALSLAFSWDGIAGVRHELRRLSFRRGNARWLVIAILAPAVAAAAAAWIGRLAGDGAPLVAPEAVLTILAFQFATGAVGEELGWRGFLLPRIGARLGEVSAVLVTAGLWSIWHVAGFYFPGTPHFHSIPAVPFLTAIFLFGVFLGLLFNRSGESVLATMIAHLSFNIALAAGGVSLSSTTFWNAVGALLGALSLFVACVRRSVPKQQTPNLK